MLEFIFKQFHCLVNEIFKSEQLVIFYVIFYNSKQDIKIKAFIRSTNFVNTWNTFKIYILSFNNFQLKLSSLGFNSSNSFILGFTD